MAARHNPSDLDAVSRSRNRKVTTAVKRIGLLAFCYSLLGGSALQQYGWKKLQNVLSVTSYLRVSQYETLLDALTNGSDNNDRRKRLCSHCGNQFQYIKCMMLWRWVALNKVGAKGCSNSWDCNIRQSFLLNVYMTGRVLDSYSER